MLVGESAQDSAVTQLLQDKRTLIETRSEELGGCTTSCNSGSLDVVR
jgi:hypothetical protein